MNKSNQNTGNCLKTYLNLYEFIAKMPRLQQCTLLLLSQESLLQKSEEYDIRLYKTVL